MDNSTIQPDFSQIATQIKNNLVPKLRYTGPGLWIEMIKKLSNHRNADHPMDFQNPGLASKENSLCK